MNVNRTITQLLAGIPTKCSSFSGLYGKQQFTVNCQHFTFYRSGFPVKDLSFRSLLLSLNPPPPETNSRLLKASFRQNVIKPYARLSRPEQTPLTCFSCSLSDT